MAAAGQLLQASGGDLGQDSRVPLQEVAEALRVVDHTVGQNPGGHLPPALVIWLLEHVRQGLNQILAENQLSLQSLSTVRTGDHLANDAKALVRDFGVSFDFGAQHHESREQRWQLGVLFDLPRVLRVCDCCSEGVKSLFQHRWTLCPQEYFQQAHHEPFCMFLVKSYLLQKC